MRNMPILEGIHREDMMRNADFPLEITLLHWFQCNLNCFYCSTRQIGKYPEAFDFNQALQDLELLSKTGLETVILQGPGEPFLYKHLLYQLLEINQVKHFNTVVITNGTLVTEEDIRQLLPMRVSLIFKIDSLEKKIMKKIYNTNDTFKFRQVKNAQLPAGFYLALKHQMNKDRRIGISCVINPMNTVNDMKPLVDILRFARQHSIIPYFNCMMECKDKDKKNILSIKKETFSHRDAFELLSRVDREEFGIFWTPVLPVAGYDHCTSRYDYVLYNGKVYKWCYSQHMVEEIFVDDLKSFIKNRNP